ncbi:glycosyltransferase [Sphingomonas melonis]|uniref:glycosyltransferase n=1 Tax=Sphingomonas melonis TaxID=152682 RepID=UPI0036A8A752
MYRETFRTLRLIAQSDVDRTAPYDIAYLIRMKDEARSLPATLDSIRRQRFAGRAIIIFLDSGSCDESVAIAAACGMPHAIYAIDPREFRFGATCNLIAELAPARYLLFLSGHVVFNHDDTIATSLAHMDAHADVAALGFRQVPNPTTGFNLYEQLYIARTFPRVDEPYVDIRTAGAFSNAASLIRTDCWRSIPFEDVIASEDHIWAQAAMARGFAVQYSSAFDVAHSHDEAPAAVYKRVRINKVARFGEAPQPLRFMKTLLGVFMALLTASRGRRPGFAATYAWAHASAYVAATNPFASLLRSSRARDQQG